MDGPSRDHLPGHTVRQLREHVPGADTGADVLHAHTQPHLPGNEESELQGRDAEDAVRVRPVRQRQDGTEGELEQVPAGPRNHRRADRWPEPDCAAGDHRNAAMDGFERQQTGGLQSVRPSSTESDCDGWRCLRHRKRPPVRPAIRDHDLRPRPSRRLEQALLQLGVLDGRPARDSAARLSGRQLLPPVGTATSTSRTTAWSRQRTTRRSV